MPLTEPIAFPFPLYETKEFTRPLGMIMAQNRLAVPLWSYAMEILPPIRIIEIGTYSGGLATALAIHAHMIGCKVVTWDRARIRKGSADEIRRQDELATFLGVDFRIADVWESETAIGDLIKSPGRTYVLCDGGDKPRELEVFSAYLKTGDLIAAHDCGTCHWPWLEITVEHGAEVAAKHGTKSWHQDAFDLAGWLVYVKPTE